jgi:hypothetical protein
VAILKEAAKPAAQALKGFQLVASKPLGPIGHVKNAIGKIGTIVFRQTPHTGGPLGNIAANMVKEIEQTVAGNIAREQVQNGFLKWVPSRFKENARGMLEQLVINSLRTLCHAKNSRHKFFNNLGDRSQAFIVGIDPNVKNNPALNFLANNVFNVFCNLRRFSA